MMVSLPALTAEDVEVLKRAFAGDNATPAVIEALCSSKSTTSVRQVVKDHLLEKDRVSTFAAGLARGIRRLRTNGVAADSVAKGRTLRAIGLCVSEVVVVAADLTGTMLAKLHRGLRLPSLLIALTEIVRDNGFGSGAQRAAASALVAFCGGSPSLWKELAREIRDDARVLKGFLGQAFTLASITDFRTQELTFEAVYRMWKVWKKQDEGPPTLPPGTPNEIKEGLATISTNAFERQVRSVLISMNERGEGEDEGDGPNLDLPSSFPVEAVHQITDWTGLGCERKIGDAQWLDFGSDTISMLVRPIVASRSRARDVPGDVFVSIPADVISTSSKATVGTRSLRVDVPFSQALAVLAAKATKKPGDQLKSPPAKVSINIFTSPGGKRQKISEKAETPLVSHPTPRKRAKIDRGSGVIASQRGVGSHQEVPAKKMAVTGSNIQVPATVRAMVRGVDPTDKARNDRRFGKVHKNIRSIAEGNADPDAVETTVDGRVGETESENDSWMESRCRLELAPSSMPSSGRRKKNSGDDKDQSRAKMPRGIGQGGIGAAIKSFKERTRTAIRKPETWDADETWRMEDEDDCVGYVEETPRKNLTQQSRSKPGTQQHPRQQRGGGIGERKGTPSTKDSTGASSVGAAAGLSSSCRGRTKSTTVCASRPGEAAGDSRWQAASEPKAKGANQRWGGTASKGNAKKTVAKTKGQKDGDSSTAVPSRREKPPRRDASAGISTTALLVTTELSSSSDEAVFSEEDEWASSKEGKSSGDDVIEQTAEEESGAENDGVGGDVKLRGHESALSETEGVVSEDEDGKAQDDVDTSEERARAGAGVAPVTDGQGHSISKESSELKETSRQGQQRENEQAIGSQDESEEDLEEARGDSNGDYADDEELTEQSTPPGVATATVQRERKRGKACAQTATGGRFAGGDESGEEMEEELDEIDENDGDSGNRGDESEDNYSVMIAKICKQMISHARARDLRVKKRKIDAAIEDARQECRDYLERTSQTVTGYWRQQAEDLVERGLQAEDAVAAARERVRALAVEHEEQWQASMDRVQKHATALKRLDNQIRSGRGTFESKLKTAWQADVEALKLNLQKHREGTLASLEKKAKSGGEAVDSSSIPSLLSRLTMRTS